MSGEQRASCKAVTHRSRLRRTLVVDDAFFFCIYSKRDTAHSLHYPFISILSYQKSTSMAKGWRICLSREIYFRPCLDGSGQILAWKKNLHGSTFRLHGMDGSGRFFEQLSVQVWDLKKAGQLFDRHGSSFVRTHVNTRTVKYFAQIAWLRPGT